MTTQTRADKTERAAGFRTSRRSPSGRGFELLESKLRPPQVLDKSVPRSALVDRLTSSRGTPVVVVSAAPGYGKTTLLSQWMARSRRAFGWASLNEQDNDPVVLLRYIATALDRIEPLSPAAFKALSSATTSVEGRIVPSLASALAGMNAAFVLVLDDFQEIHDRQCLDAIDVLVDHLPRGSQLVLSGQIQPSRRLGTLRAHERLLELGPSDLRMDEREAGELLAQAGLELPDDDLAELLERTEGWPGGLYLAALSIREDGGSIASFRGDDRLITDYLRDELLSRLPEDRLRFLTRTAVLERMCGPLCDSVMQTSGSAATLESLERSNLFVVSLDSNREWYRYHGLFRDLLRAELERADPRSVPELLGRAADWCDENELPAEAVGYAQAAGDVERVARLVERWGQREYQGGAAATVDRWLRWLERHGSLDTVPRVAVLGAWLSGIRGRPGDAERWTEAAERGSQDLAKDKGATLVQAWLAVLRAGRCERGVERMRADAELAERSFGRDSKWWPTPALLLAISHLLAGDAELADDLFADIAESAPAVGGSNAVSIALAERGTLAAARGEWVEAEAFVERADTVIRRSGMEEYPPNAVVNALEARVAAHRGEASRAERLLTRAQRLRPQLTRALLPLAIHARLELARAYVALADPAAARTLLREANGLMRRGMGLGRLEEDAREIEASLESVRADAPGASSLTTAELRLLPQLPTHLSFREIGDRLYLSRHTVKSQAMSIYRKLDVTSRNAAVERARTLGLLDE